MTKTQNRLRTLSGVPLEVPLKVSPETLLREYLKASTDLIEYLIEKYNVIEIPDKYFTAFEAEHVRAVWELTKGDKL